MTVLDKTLEELDGVGWGEPNFESYLVINIHRLRRVPLHEFTVEDLCLLIGQQIGLEYLVPIALERLSSNPFVDCGYFEGDLLISVAGVPETFWNENPDLFAQWQPLIPCIAAVKNDDLYYPTLESTNGDTAGWLYR